MSRSIVSINTSYASHSVCTATDKCTHRAFGRVGFQIMFHTMRRTATHHHSHHIYLTRVFLTFFSSWVVFRTARFLYITREVCFPAFGQKQGFRQFQTVIETHHHALAQRPHTPCKAVRNVTCISQVVKVALVKILQESYEDSDCVCDVGALQGCPQGRLSHLTKVLEPRYVGSPIHTSERLEVSQRVSSLSSRPFVVRLVCGDGLQ